LSSLVPETSFAQGASGAANVYDTSPAGLGLSPSYLAAGATASATATTGAAGTRLDYAQITASVNVTATSEATANTLVDGNSITYDGTRVRVEFWCPEFVQASGADTYVVLLRDSTVLGRAQIENIGAVPQAGFPLVVVFYDTPSAAAHTYHVKGYLNGAATATARAGAGGATTALPAFLEVTKS
jgi:hypothetical protein